MTKVGHDIEAINAALRLGDPALPPKGTLVAFDAYGEDYHFVITGRAENDFLAIYGLLPSKSPSKKSWDAGPWQRWGSLDPRPGLRHDAYSVIGFVQDVPPFEEWERP